jgi:hypothetical protein
VPPMHQPAAIAIIDHPDLGTLRAVGSFRPEERELFEAQFACWSMRCIYYGDDRYLLGSEYDGSGGCHDEWDEAAIQSQYAKDANHFDLRDLKQARLLHSTNSRTYKPRRSSAISRACYR